MSDTGLRVALQRIWRGEHRLDAYLRTLAERQVTEHEVHHVALDLARWSADSAAQVAALADQLHQDPITTIGQDLEPEVPSRPWAEAEASGLRLLEDLCQTYLLASANSLAWKMLAQVAQATQEAGALELASRCHPQTLRQVRWANTMIKTAAPQILASL
jgi:hypothetical protein